MCNFYSGWYRSSPTNQSDRYYLEITPDGWTFSVIWGIIYVWQAQWLIYGLTTVCRQNSDGGYLYTDPSYMPIIIYIFFSLNLISNSAWIFVFDRQLIEIALGLLIAAVGTVYVSIGFSLHALQRNTPDLLRMKLKREIGLVIGLVQNGMAFYATWITIATHLGLAIVLAYTAGMNQQDACSIVLGMLGFFIILYNLLDTLVINKYSKYLMTPYFVLILALVGSLTGNGDALGRNFIITCVLMGLSVFAFIYKIAIVIKGCRAKDTMA